jgi:NAD(P)-dependent dehydrogenase (short-subunit alcohol dehydrogenase family)
VDVKDRRIRVNALSPGYIDTAPWHFDSVTEIRANIMSSGSVPSGRFGASDEVAKFAAFLASDDSSYFTGTELFVDGGVAQL